MKRQPVMVTQVHPLALAMARRLTADPARLIITSPREVIVVNRPGMPLPVPRRKRARQ